MTSPLRLFLVVSLPLAALNLLNQASRTVMAIIGPLLATEFALSASELGMLAACMFAAYGAAQLPVGVALDVIGPRRLQASMALLAAAGFAVFALANGIAGLAAARVILGVGISAALMAVIKAHSQWCPPAQVTNMTGIALIVGALGSVLTTTPVEAVLPSLGWRGVFWVMCVASLATAAWIYVSVPEKAATGPARSLAAEFGVVGSILASRRFWRYGPAAAFLSTMNFAYLGLWAGPWLRDVAHYDGPARAQTLFWYTLALMAGGYVTGWAASKAQAAGWSRALVPGATTVGLIAAQAGLMLQPTTPAAVVSLWLLFAFCASAGPVGYIAVSQMFPPEQTGRVSTAINALTLAGAFALQAAVGTILDLWPRTAAGGWDPRGYSAALALSLVVQAALALLAIGAPRRGTRA
ncbi:MAG: MFS transporter [Burkholderiales bacterium]|nr:MFS transporter [Burkholderiales bacterium]